MKLVAFLLTPFFERILKTDNNNKYWSFEKALNFVAIFMHSDFILAKIMASNSVPKEDKRVIAVRSRSYEPYEDWLLANGDFETIVDLFFRKGTPPKRIRQMYDCVLSNENLDSTIIAYIISNHHVFSEVIQVSQPSSLYYFIHKIPTRFFTLDLVDSIIRFPPHRFEFNIFFERFKKEIGMEDLTDDWAMRALGLSNVIRD